MDQHQNPDKVASRPIQGEPSAPAASSPLAEPGLRVPVPRRIDLRLPWWQYPTTVVLFVVILVLLLLGFGVVISMANRSATPTTMAYKATIFPSGQIWETKEAKPPEKSPWQPYVGRWALKDDKGEVWGYFNLKDDKTATKDRVPDATGTWEIVGNECQITWSDGWKDILRPQPDGVTRLAFRPGTSWRDEPGNIQHATREPLKK
jgi:hypothetical protein